MTRERIHNAKDTPSQTNWSAMPEPTQTCRSKTCPSSLSMTCTTFLCLLSYMFTLHSHTCSYISGMMRVLVKDSSHLNPTPARGSPWQLSRLTWWILSCHPVKTWKNNIGQKKHCKIPGKTKTQNQTDCYFHCLISELNQSVVGRVHVEHTSAKRFGITYPPKKKLDGF